MWTPPRRVQVAALAACASLALLLLHALPPSLPPPPPPRPAPAARALAASTPSAPGNTSTSTPAPAPPARNVTSPPAAQARVPAGAVLTGALYEAGHTRPHPELCPSLGASLRLVILVASAPEHAAARDAIRLTWGHYAARSDLALAFLVGAVDPQGDKGRQRDLALDREDKLYGDVIRGRSVDSYSNLTLKTLSMLEWMDSYCPRAPLLLKTDDDMFINVPRLLWFADRHRAGNGTIWGRVIRRSLPKRTTKSKYYVSPVQYAGKWYPDFATGPAYLVTRDVIPRLLAAAPAQPYLRLEDVFVTGVLGSLLGIKRVNDGQFYNKRVSPHPCSIQRGIAIHMVRYHEQFDMWRKLLDGKTVCKHK